MIADIFDLNGWSVVRVLQLGFLGLAFFLALWSFWLLAREQKKEKSNPATLKEIRNFRRFTLILGGLALGSQLIDRLTNLLQSSPIAADRKQSRQSTSSQADYDSTYRVESCALSLDMSAWRPVEAAKIETDRISPCVISRVETIHKLMDIRENYENVSWTTGVTIDEIVVDSEWPTTFVKEGQVDHRKKFRLRVASGAAQNGEKFQVASSLAHWNGYQGGDGDDFRISIKVPTDFLTVVIRFPSQKRVLENSINVSVQDVHEEPQGSPLATKRSASSVPEPVGGQLFLWSASKLKPDTFVFFEWKWDDRKS